MRGSATFGPNSPREMTLGVAMPRAIQPEIGVEIERQADDGTPHGHTRMSQ